MSRTFTAHSALGEQLQFRTLTGYERMGHLYELRVRLLSDAQDISAKVLLGTDMTVEVDLTTKLGGSGKRYLSGLVTAFLYYNRHRYYDRKIGAYINQDPIGFKAG
jgi:type VI secretion system secreted protein VgrG